MNIINFIKNTIKYWLIGISILLFAIIVVTNLNKNVLAEKIAEGKEITSELKVLYDEKAELEKGILEKEKIRDEIDKEIHELTTNEIYYLKPKTDKLDLNKVQAIITRYNSPLNAQEYIDSCSKYPVEMCKLYLGIMVHESKLCTVFYKPDIEKGYFNCAGLKSQEILTTHKADSNGSWLRKFESYKQFFDIALEKFYNGYWLKGATTPETVVSTYVGHYSQNWVNTCHNTINQL